MNAAFSPTRFCYCMIKYHFLFRLSFSSRKCHKRPFSPENSKAKICFIPCSHSYTTLPPFICKFKSDTSNLVIKGLGIKPVLLNAFPKRCEIGNNPALLYKKISLNSGVTTLKNRSQQSNGC